MRKRVINHVADTIFWYILYFLPVLAYLMFVVSAPFRDVTHEEGYTASVEYREQWYFNLPSDTPISNAGGSMFDITDKYVAGFVQLNYTENNETVWFRMPVIINNDSDPAEARHFYNQTPVLNLRFDSSTDSNYYTRTPFKVAVPYDNFFANKTVEFRTMLNGSNRIFVALVLPRGFYTVEYVATELADGITYDFKDFVNSMGFEFATDNIIVNSLADIFGTGGIMPMFDNDTPFIIFAWFIGVYLLHLLVDFLLFIPRIAHKWMKDCTGGD